MLKKSSSVVNLEDFANIITSLGSLKVQLTSIQHQIRSLEKGVLQQQKIYDKQVQKQKCKGNKKPSGFAKAAYVSDDLCNFMNLDKGSTVARTEVTQYIIKYIKENKLQSDKNKKIIIPNKQLQDLFGTNNEDEITYFNMQKYMNKHFNKSDEIVKT